LTTNEVEVGKSIKKNEGTKNEQQPDPENNNTRKLKTFPSHFKRGSIHLLGSVRKTHWRPSCHGHTNHRC